MLSFGNIFLWDICDKQHRKERFINSQAQIFHGRILNSLIIH